MTVDVTAEIAKRRIEAKRAIRKKGLVLPERPEYELPQLPSNITDLGDDRLMRYLRRFTAYQDYVQGQLAQAEIDEGAAESQLEIAKAKYLAANWSGGSGERIAISKAEATLDEDVQVWEEQVGGCKARRKVLGVLYDSVTRNAAVVSREITRRVGRESTDRRGNRYGGS